MLHGDNLSAAGHPSNIESDSYQNPFEDFSDLVQETLEGDKPAFRDADLRRSLTAS